MQKVEASWHLQRLHILVFCVRRDDISRAWDFLITIVVNSYKKRLLEILRMSLRFSEKLPLGKAHNFSFAPLLRYCAEQIAAVSTAFSPRVLCRESPWFFSLDLLLQSPCFSWNLRGRHVLCAIQFEILEQLGILHLIRPWIAFIEWWGDCLISISHASCVLRSRAQNANVSSFYERRNYVLISPD